MVSKKRINSFYFSGYWIAWNIIHVPETVLSFIFGCPCFDYIHVYQLKFAKRYKYKLPALIILSCIILTSLAMKQKKLYYLTKSYLLIIIYLLHVCNCTKVFVMFLLSLYGMLFVLIYQKKTILFDESRVRTATRDNRA